MKKIAIRKWDDLDDRKPKAALLAGADLAVTRYDDPVSVPAASPASETPSTRCCRDAGIIRLTSLAYRAFPPDVWRTPRH